MGARSKARKRALDVLFEAEQRSAPVLDTLASRVAASDPPVGEYAVELVEGVAAHQQQIDELLGAHSRDWPLDRMPAVDRAILRLATYELLWRDDVPDAVVIDEAVEAREEGRSRVILFNLCGHGHFDLSAYERYLSGALEDYEYPAEKVAEALHALEGLPVA